MPIFYFFPNWVIILFPQVGQLFLGYIFKKVKFTFSDSLEYLVIPPIFINILIAPLAYSVSYTSIEIQVLP